ncbi:MAG: Gfo/Idh/MocA family oxidoreductase [Chloroflexota bacterium]|nr:MAG: Gfo/Idh/MocA family oxidoreductase [Chloroflexota bacterium]
MPKLRAAIAGTGFMGPAHTEGLRRLGIEVVGIVGSSPEKSARAAASLSIETGYGSYAELLADRRVDVVHITTPNRLHFTMARDALAAGKHVLCEKPLAMNAVESAALVDQAARSGKAAGVNYNIRFYPLCLEARARVRRGDIGDVHAIQGSYVQDWLLFPTDYNWRVLADEGGSLRAVADIGTHWLDLVQSITGLDVVEVCADLHTIHPVRQRSRGEVETFSGKLAADNDTIPIDIATEDVGSIMLRFSNGARGSLWVSQATAGRKNSLKFELSGSKAAVAWDSERPNEMWVGYRDRPNETLIKDPSLLDPSTRRFVGYPGGHNEGYPDTFKQCFRAFYEYVETGDMSTTPDFPTFSDGHKEIRLCDAILASHRSGAWIGIR